MRAAFDEADRWCGWLVSSASEEEQAEADGRLDGWESDNVTLVAAPVAHAAATERAAIRGWSAFMCSAWFNGSASAMNETRSALADNRGQKSKCRETTGKASLSPSCDE